MSLFDERSDLGAKDYEGEQKPSGFEKFISKPSPRKFQPFGGQIQQAPQTYAAPQYYEQPQTPEPKNYNVFSDDELDTYERAKKDYGYINQYSAAASQIANKRKSAYDDFKKNKLLPFFEQSGGFGEFEDDDELAAAIDEMEAAALKTGQMEDGWLGPSDEKIAAGESLKNFKLWSSPNGLRDQYRRLRAERDQYQGIADSYKNQKMQRLEQLTNIPIPAREALDEALKSRGKSPGSKKSRNELLNGMSWEQPVVGYDGEVQNLEKVDPRAKINPAIGYDGQGNQSSKAQRERVAAAMRGDVRGVLSRRKHIARERQLRDKGFFFSESGLLDGRPIGLSRRDVDLLDIDDMRKAGMTSYQGRPLDEAMAELGGEERLEMAKVMESVYSAKSNYEDAQLAFLKVAGGSGAEKAREKMEAARDDMQKTIGLAAGYGLDNELFEQAETTSWLGGLGNAIKRGMLMSEMSNYTDDFLTNTLDADEMQRFIEIASEIEKLPTSSTMKRVKETKSDGFLDAMGNLLFDNPAAIPEMFVESLSSFLPATIKSMIATVPAGAAAGAAMGGLPGAKIGAAYGARASWGVASFILEASGMALEGMQELNIDWKNPKVFAAAWTNESIRNKIQKKMVQKGVPIAIADTLTGMMAGKVMGVVNHTGNAMFKGGKLLNKEAFNKATGAVPRFTLMQKTRNAAVELGADSTMGMGGEYLGQWASKEPGEDWDWDAIAAEGLIGVGPGALGAALEMRGPRANYFGNAPIEIAGEQQTEGGSMGTVTRAGYSAPYQTFNDADSMMAHFEDIVPQATSPEDQDRRAASLDFTRRWVNTMFKIRPEAMAGLKIAISPRTPDANLKNRGTFESRDGHNIIYLNEQEFAADPMGTLLHESGHFARIMLLKDEELMTAWEGLKPAEQLDAYTQYFTKDYDKSFDQHDEKTQKKIRRAFNKTDKDVLAEEWFSYQWARVLNANYKPDKSVKGIEKFYTGLVRPLFAEYTGTENVAGNKKGDELIIDEQVRRFLEDGFRPSMQEEIDKAQAGMDTLKAEYQEGLPNQKAVRENKKARTGIRNALEQKLKSMMLPPKEARKIAKTLNAMAGEKLLSTDFSFYTRMEQGSLRAAGADLQKREEALKKEGKLVKSVDGGVQLFSDELANPGKKETDAKDKAPKTEEKQEPVESLLKSGVKKPSEAKLANARKQIDRVKDLIKNESDPKKKEALTKRLGRLEKDLNSMMNRGKDRVYTPATLKNKPQPQVLQKSDSVREANLKKQIAKTEERLRQAEGKPESDKLEDRLDGLKRKLEAEAKQKEIEANKSRFTMTGKEAEAKETKRNLEKRKKLGEAPPQDIPKETEQFNDDKLLFEKRASEMMALDSLIPTNITLKGLGWVKDISKSVRVDLNKAANSTRDKFKSIEALDKAIDQAIDKLGPEASSGQIIAEVLNLEKLLELAPRSFKAEFKKRVNDNLKNNRSREIEDLAAEAHEKIEDYKGQLRTRIADIDKQIEQLQKGLPEKSKPGTLQERMTEAMVNAINPSAEQKGYLSKEQEKTKVATQFIGDGVTGSSTANYRDMYATEKVSNTGKYSSSDIVFVSSNGDRKNRINPIKDDVLQGKYQNLDKAIEAGAAIIMDDYAHLVKTKKYNTGELALANYVKSKGYSRVDRTGMWTKDGKAPIQKPQVASQKPQAFVFNEKQKKKGYLNKAVKLTQSGESFQAYPAYINEDLSEYSFVLKKVDNKGASSKKLWTLVEVSSERVFGGDLQQDTLDKTVEAVRSRLNSNKALVEKVKSVAQKSGSKTEAQVASQKPQVASQKPDEGDVTISSEIKALRQKRDLAVKFLDLVAPEEMAIDWKDIPLANFFYQDGFERKPVTLGMLAGSTKPIEERFILKTKKGNKLANTDSRTGQEFLWDFLKFFNVKNAPTELGALGMLPDGQYVKPKQYELILEAVKASAMFNQKRKIGSEAKGKARYEKTKSYGPTGYAQEDPNGFEVSSKAPTDIGRAFSAFNAKLSDGKSIEYHYQVNVKGYSSIAEGKGKPPLLPAVKDGGGFFEDIYRQVKTNPKATVLKKQHDKIETAIERNSDPEEDARLRQARDRVYKELYELLPDKKEREINKDLDSYGEYKKLWERFAKENPKKMEQLRNASKGKKLTDQFATTPVNQARALYEIFRAESKDGEAVINIEASKGYPSGYQSKKGGSLAAIVAERLRKNKKRSTAPEPLSLNPTVEEILALKAANGRSLELLGDPSDTERDFNLLVAGILRDGDVKDGEGEYAEIEDYARVAREQIANGTPVLEALRNIPSILQRKKFEEDAREADSESAISENADIKPRGNKIFITKGFNVPAEKDYNAVKVMDAKRGSETVEETDGHGAFTRSKIFETFDALSSYSEGRTKKEVENFKKNRTNIQKNEVMPARPVSGSKKDSDLQSTTDISAADFANWYLSEGPDAKSGKADDARKGGLTRAQKRLRDLQALPSSKDNKQLPGGLGEGLLPYVFVDFARAMYAKLGLKNARDIYEKAQVATKNSNFKWNYERGKMLVDGKPSDEFKPFVKEAERMTPEGMDILAKPIVQAVIDAEGVDIYNQIDPNEETMLQRDTQMGNTKKEDDSAEMGDDSGEAEDVFETESEAVANEQRKKDLIYALQTKPDALKDRRKVSDELLEEVYYSGTASSIVEAAREELDRRGVKGIRTLNSDAKILTSDADQNLSKLGILARIASGNSDERAEEFQKWMDAKKQSIKTGSFKMNFVDRADPLKQFHRGIVNILKKVGIDENHPLYEQLNVHGRLHQYFGSGYETVEQAELNFINPIKDLLREHNIDLKTFGEYLLARAAPSRNRQIKARADELLADIKAEEKEGEASAKYEAERAKYYDKDGKFLLNSGIDEATAIKVVKKLEANSNFKKFAEKALPIYYRMNLSALDKLVDSGMIQQIDEKTEQAGVTGFREKTAMIKAASRFPWAKHSSIKMPEDVGNYTYAPMQGFEGETQNYLDGEAAWEEFGAAGTGGSGKGFDQPKSRGILGGAFGRSGAVGPDPNTVFAVSVNQYFNNNILAAKNEVAQSFGSMFEAIRELTHPQKDSATNPEFQGRFLSEDAQKLLKDLSKLDEGMIKELKSEFDKIFEPDYKMVEGKKLYEYPDSSDKLVMTEKQLSTVYKNDPLTFVYRQGGQAYLIKFKSTPEGLRMADTMKNLRYESLPSILQFFNKGTRFMARMFTSMNPAFIIPNFFRDLGTAAIHLTEDGKKKMFKDAVNMKNIGSFAKAIFKTEQMIANGDNPNKNPEIKKLLDLPVKELAKSTHPMAGIARYQKAKQNGAKIGYFRHESVPELIRGIQKDLKKNKKGLSKKGLAKLGSFVDSSNTAIENSIRMSSFWAAIKNGYTEDQAAVIARNVTVDFNQKGNLTQALGSLYVFFGASMNSMHRFVTSWNRRSTEDKIKMFGGIAAASMTIALFNRLVDDDEDEEMPDYDTISSYKRDTNFILPLPAGLPEFFNDEKDTGYFSIPLPLGYNLFWTLGQVAADMFAKNVLGRGGEGFVGGSTRIMDSAMNAFNPIGGATIATIGTPSLVTPLVELYANKNFMGRPIRYDDQPFEVPKPAYMQDPKSTPKHWNDLSKAINSFMGGSETVKGSVKGMFGGNPLMYSSDEDIQFDLSGNEMRHAILGYLGGPGQIADSMLGAMITGAQGESSIRNINDIPMINRFLRATTYGSQTRDTFYGLRDAIKTAEKAVKTAKEISPQAYASVLKDNKSLLQLSSQISALDKQKNKLRRLRNKIEGSKALSEEQKTQRVDEIQKKELNLMVAVIKKAQSLGIS